MAANLAPRSSFVERAVALVGLIGSVITIVLTVYNTKTAHDIDARETALKHQQQEYENAYKQRQQELDTLFKQHAAAYFSPSWTAFQADRGRDFSVIVDGVSN